MLWTDLKRARFCFCICQIYINLAICTGATTTVPAAAQSASKPGYNTAVPNGVRPDKAHNPSAEDTRAAEDSVSEADSAGWETASDEDDTDASLSQAELTANTSGAKSAEDAIRQTSASGVSSSSSQPSLDTPATPSRGAEASVRGQASDEASSAQDVEEWDLKRSFFDNHMSSSMEANLEYMFKHFGFYLPDAEYLSDPAGLIKYLVSHAALRTVFHARSSNLPCRACFWCLLVYCQNTLCMTGCMIGNTLCMTGNRGNRGMIMVDKTHEWFSCFQFPGTQPIYACACAGSQAAIWSCPFVHQR